MQAVRFAISFDRFERSFGTSSDRPAGWLLFGLSYGWCMVCCVDVIWWRWYDTLLSVSFNMLLYAWLGMLIEWTCCWIHGSVCCWIVHCCGIRYWNEYVVWVNWVVMSLRVIVLVQVVFRWNRAVGTTFVHIEYPEKDTQITNLMMISKKVKKFNNFHCFIEYSFLTSFIIFVGTEHTYCWQHILSPY